MIFEILEFVQFRNLKPFIWNPFISNLDTKFLNFDDFCQEKFEIDKIGDISKFEILNPKIQNLKSLTLKVKSQNCQNFEVHIHQNLQNWLQSPKFCKKNS